MPVLAIILAISELAIMLAIPALAVILAIPYWPFMTISSEHTLLTEVAGYCSRPRPCWVKIIRKRAHMLLFLAIYIPFKVH